MDTPDDQPRPDLDAAIDAVLPSLTAVSDDAAAASLRRTRLALDARGSARRASGWGWGLAATAAAGAAIATLAFWPAAPVEGPRIAVVEPRPAAAPSPLPAVAPRVAATAVPPAPVRSIRLGRTVAAPVSIETSGPERLADLIRAVQEIPDDAWTASRVRVESPVVVPEVSVAALDLPRVGTLPADEFTPGEP